MKIESLEQLLQEELRDLYDAEKQLVKAIPKMAKAASSPELREALNDHLEVTKGQVQRLEQVFESLGTKPKGKTCAAMKGLIEEGGEVLEQDATDELKDAAIIGAAQRVEHYEMAAYGTARAFAEKLGHEDVAELLQETLSEEEDADQKLTEVSAAILENISVDEEEPEKAPAKAGAKTRRSSGM